MTDILMLIKTSELEFDDRLKKETVALSNLNKSVSIRAVLQRNAACKGQIFSDNQFKTYSLLSRVIFPQRKFLAFKALEMYIYFVLAILRLRPEIIWVHNIEMIGLFPILSFLKKINITKKIVWDQHELPLEHYFESKKMKNRLQKAYNKCDIVIAANNARLNLIKSSFNIKNGKVILNMPHSSFINAEKSELDTEYQKWCKNRMYFITCGLVDDNLRYVSKIAEAIMNFEEFCLVVLGPYSQDTIKIIEEKARRKIEDKILFTGLVNQNKIINLTDHAFCSIVFYNMDKINNKYCAPNRLYQAVVRGIPLITGNNPPLADFINEYKIGYVLNSDGRDVNEIIVSIKDMEINRDVYLSNLSKIKNRFNWDVNLQTIAEISKIK
jgi:glycosyltransferase involved in cell wall biosynthesis